MNEQERKELFGLERKMENYSHTFPHSTEAKILWCNTVTKIIHKLLDVHLKDLREPL